MFNKALKFFKAGLRKVLRRKFIWGFDKYCSKKEGRALIYYKTDYFALGGILEDRSHVNEWESYEIAVILNKLGFVVDIADRTILKNDVDRIEDKYDFFIGIGAGDSGKHFIDIAKKVPSATRVLFALGPEPDLSNKITKARHELFLTR